MNNPKTLDCFLKSKSFSLPKDQSSKLAQLVKIIASACIQITHVVRKGPLTNLHGDAQHQNIQGEKQKKLDVFTNELLKCALISSSLVAAVASEEEDNIVPANENGEFVVAFDPLDGSSNIDINGQIGTIFGIYPKVSSINYDSPEQFLQPGVRQICAGYVLYAASTQLVIALGSTVNVFTFDEDDELFKLTNENLKVPVKTQDFAINMSKRRFWSEPMLSYINGLELGKNGSRGKDFNMRWNGAMVGDVHRILINGGVFLYPSDNRDPNQPARLRLLYEANPMAMIIENAGGKAWSESGRILDINPVKLHERVTVFMGAWDEIDVCLETIKKG